MKMIKILLITIILFALASCGKKMFLRSYITTYYATGLITLEERRSIENHKIIGIRHGSDNVRIGGYSSTGSEKKQYDALCRKHNDMSYNRTVIHNSPADEIWTHYLGMDFVSLKIVSNSNFDERHPAGTDLGDIIRYAYYSPKKYIDSGYKAEFNWLTAGWLSTMLYTATADATPIMHSIEKLASELTIDDLVLLGPGLCSDLGVLMFETQPTLSRTHHLTVTLTTDDGKTLSASVDITF